jgi:type I site-specific restriction endonuclease
VEAKPDSWGAKITAVETQSSGYAEAHLKWVKSTVPLPFVYEATGILTRFTDGRDPKTRSREAQQPDEAFLDRAPERQVADRQYDLEVARPGGSEFRTLCTPARDQGVGGEGGLGDE